MQSLCERGVLARGLHEIGHPSEAPAPGEGEIPRPHLALRTISPPAGLPPVDVPSAIMDRQIFHAMNSQNEFLRQARRVEHLVNIATSSPTKSRWSDDDRKLASALVLEREVRAELRRKERDQTLTLESRGRISKNRQTTEYRTITKTEKRFLPDPTGDGDALIMQDVPMFVERRLFGLHDTPVKKTRTKTAAGL